jgi:hypothetical protein
LIEISGHVMNLDVDIVLCFRFNCPVDVLQYVDEMRLGGWRKFNFSNEPEFQLILMSGDRLIIGLNVEAHYDAPFVREWLRQPEFIAAYTNSSGNVVGQWKLNMARWALATAVANAVRDVNNAIQIHVTRRAMPHNYSQRFIQGTSSCAMRNVQIISCYSEM